MFSLVVKHTSIRFLLSVVVSKNLELDQLDVKTSFLHGHLDETIYMAKHKRFEAKGKEDHFCLVHKSIYRQSPRCWYKRFNDYIKSIGKRSSYDICVYVNSLFYKKKFYLLLYVDDMLLARSSKEDLTHVKNLLKREFDLKDMSQSIRILGIETEREKSSYVINKKTNKLL